MSIGGVLEAGVACEVEGDDGALRVAQRAVVVDAHVRHARQHVLSHACPGLCVCLHVAEELRH